MKLGVTIPMDGQMASLGVRARSVSPLETEGEPARNAPVRAGSATLEADTTTLLQAPTHRARSRVVADPMTGSPADQWAATAPMLAGTQRVRLGRERRGGLMYPTGAERPLTTRLPSAPAAVRIYGDDGCCATICLDLDSSRDGADAVAREAKKLTKWLAECGARVIEDVSPNGGRHIYIPLAQRLPLPEAYEIVQGLTALFRTLDSVPHSSALTGCIRTPGSVHKSGGHQQLVTTLAAAVDVLHRPNPADVVQAMRIRLAPQIAAWHARVARARELLEIPEAAEDTTAPGAMRALSLAITRIARAGIYDTSRYGSASEARMAVITAAARAGWTLPDVVVRLKDNRWPGLAGMYAASRPKPTERTKRLVADWRKAQAFIARTPQTPRDPNVPRSNTSEPRSLAGGIYHPARELAGTHLEYQFIRTWNTAFHTYELERFKGLGLSVRFLMRALGEAASKSGSRYFAFGTRNLSIAAGNDYTTVSVQLKVLVDLGWIDLLETGRGRAADTYALTIPHDINAAELRWLPGKIHALRPAFRELGHVAALVFEALELQRATTITGLVSVTGLHRSSVSEVIDALTAYGLVERTPQGLIVHPDRLARVAEYLGVTEVIAAQVKTYAKHRQDWHAWLSRYDHTATEAIAERDFFDPETDEYWLPPPDDYMWTMAELLVA